MNFLIKLYWYVTIMDSSNVIEVTFSVKGRQAILSSFLPVPEATLPISEDI
jgi:hypothetical protein